MLLPYAPTENALPVGNLSPQTQIGVQLIIELQILGNVALAMILSALIGLERELADKPAGFRTHMLVGGAAALLVGISEGIVASFDIAPNRTTSNLVQVDPIRIIEAIIAGVSFLGAGTIFRSKEASKMEGLTTAASLLFVAGLGISVAVSQLILAIGATLLALLVLYAGKRLEHRLLRLFKEKQEKPNSYQ